MLYFEPFLYMSFNKPSQLFINIDMDIEESFGDLMKFRIATLIENGTYPITRKMEYITTNEREFQRNLTLKEFSEFSGNEPGINEKYFNM